MTATKIDSDKRDMVLDYLTSGMSMKEFACKMDIPQGALYSYIEDLRKAEPELFEDAFPKQEDLGWVKVSMPVSAPSIIVRRSGFEIDIPNGTSSEDILCVLLAVSSL